jgi:hypothetical protein
MNDILRKANKTLLQHFLGLGETEENQEIFGAK